MFFPLLQVLFIALKLTGVIAWSWWIVLIPAILHVVILIAVSVLAGLGFITLTSDRRRRF